MFLEAGNQQTETTNTQAKVQTDGEMIAERKVTTTTAARLHLVAQEATMIETDRTTMMEEEDQTPEMQAAHPTLIGHPVEAGQARKS